MEYHIPEYREVNWTCQEEEVAEVKAAAKAAAKVEDRAGVKAAEVAGARAADGWDPEAAKGREPRIYAAARLVGPACRMNAASRAFR
jgi:hypothetical protein